MRQSRKRIANISEAETTGAEKLLIEHGKTFPHVPGLIRSPVSLCPPAIRVVLKYNFRCAVISAVGALSLQVFSANGMFDPDITGVGGQPLGYDQWSAFYQRYRVLASSCEATWSTPDAGSNDAQTLRICLVPSSIASTFTNFEAAASQPYAKSRYVNGVIPNGAAILRSTMESAVMNGMTKQGILTNDETSALTSANPSDQWYWHCYMSTVDSTASASGFVFGTVYYLVDFFDRNLLSLSSTDVERFERGRMLERKSSKTKF